MSYKVHIKYGVGALLLFATFIMLGGCGSSHRVIKRGDPEEIYAMALAEYEAENWNDASSLFAFISTYYEGSSRDDTVKFFNARSLFKNRDYQSASQALDEFRRQYGRSIFLEDAEGMYTLCHYYLAPGPTRDSGMITGAIMVITEFLSRYPDSEQVEVFEKLRDELSGRLHEKSFANAYTYYKIGYYKSAIIAFRNALREYPESEYRERISYFIVASAYELADNSVEKKKEDRYLDMIDAYYTFIAAYPESEYTDEVNRMLKKANRYIDSLKGIVSEDEEDVKDNKSKDRKEREKEIK